MMSSDFVLKIKADNGEVKVLRISGDCTVEVDREDGQISLKIGKRKRDEAVEEVPEITVKKSRSDQGSINQLLPNGATIKIEKDVEEEISNEARPQQQPVCLTKNQKRNYRNNQRKKRQLARLRQTVDLLQKKLDK